MKHCLLVAMGRRPVHDDVSGCGIWRGTAIHPRCGMLSALANSRTGAQSRRTGLAIAGRGRFHPTGPAGQEMLARAKQPNGSPILALTFDDVLLKPGLSDVLPSEVDIRTRVTREIRLNIPII